MMQTTKVYNNGTSNKVENAEFIQYVHEEQSINELMSYYRCAMMEVETKFNILNDQFSLQYDKNPIETIKTRLKQPKSIIEKMKRRNVPLNMDSLKENIFDVAGVRVICSFPKDVYILADCFLKQDNVKLMKKKDYIKNPKRNGYRSLHLIVEVPVFSADGRKDIKVEVQLRTIAMDFWASLEHKLRYKKDMELNTQGNISMELYECAQISMLLDNKMENIRERI